MKIKSQNLNRHSQQSIERYVTAIKKLKTIRRTPYIKENMQHLIRIAS